MPLLAEHLAARGLLAMDTAAASSFSAIRAFLFGEEYTAELWLNGKVESYRFDTLEEALGVLVSEFERDPNFYPAIEIVDYVKTRKGAFGALPTPVGHERSGFAPDDMPKKQQEALAFTLGSLTVPTFGPAATRVLAVTRAERNLMFPMPTLQSYAEDIRQAVTYYSISGSWDQLDGRSNL